MLTEEAISNNSLQTEHSTKELLNKTSILHRVKRKGIGSFFGAKSKTSPNTLDNTNVYGQFPQHGYSGSIQNSYGPGTAYYYSNNYREANLYYLVVSVISFGVIVYCCHQCKVQTRSDLETYRIRELDARQRQLNTTSDDSSTFNNSNRLQSTTNDQVFKASAPPLTPSDVNTFRNDTILPNQISNQINYANSDYPEHPPPSYEEAVDADKHKQSLV